MTIFYGIRIDREEQMDEIEKHLSMNGYTFSVAGDMLYIIEDEFEYLKTIFEEHGTEYEVV